MKRTKIKKCVMLYAISATMILSFFFPRVTLANISLPWSTTFDCADWLTYSDPLNCDGIGKGGSWATSSGHYDQIISAANNSAGGGGKGYRHWVGDGINNNGGGITVSFSPQTELWMRWYHKWALDFQWNTLIYDKLLYFDMGQSGSTIIEPYGFDKFTFRLYTGTQDYQSASGTGWDTIMSAGALDGNGHRKSDGQWHCFEIHIKQETSGNSNAELDFWIDGVSVMHETGFQFGDSTGWETITLNSNQRTVNNGVDMPVDMDDIAISNTGYIGPLGGGGAGNDTTSPTVNMTNPVDGQTLSGSFSITADAHDNVAIADIQFQIDGQNIGSKVSQSPYQYSLDTLNLSDGSHSLRAIASDTSSNQATSSSINFTVDNSGSENGTSLPLFTDSFDDTNFTARGWYDNTNLSLSTTEHINGSLASAEFHFFQGATTPTSGGAIRKKFTDTDEVYVKYSVKYSSNWTGSNKNYHPHEFMLLTNLDSDWSNLAYTHLTAYIEQNEGIPLLGIQDGQNIDEAQIGSDLTSITENRSVAGCNGDSDGYGDGSCYSSGSIHWNGKEWRAGSVYFQDTPGAYYKNDWHTIEAYIKLNTISGGKAVADGQLKYWLDGNLLIDHNNVVMRTGQHPDMKFNQFVIAPWIGDGSPVDQTFWVDNLSVATSRPTVLLPPTSLEIIP